MHFKQEPNKKRREQLKSAIRHGWTLGRDEWATEIEEEWEEKERERESWWKSERGQMQEKSKREAVEERERRGAGKKRGSKSDNGREERSEKREKLVRQRSRATLERAAKPVWTFMFQEAGNYEIPLTHLSIDSLKNERPNGEKKGRKLVKTPTIHLAPCPEMGPQLPTCQLGNGF